MCASVCTYGGPALVMSIKMSKHTKNDALVDKDDYIGNWFAVDKFHDDD